MKLIHKGLILISLPLVFEIFFAIRFVDLLHHSKQHIDRDIHAKEVTRNVARIQALLTESTTIAGLSRVYKSKAYSERYNTVWKEVAADFRALKKIANKEERAIFPEMTKLLSFIRYGQTFIATSSEAEDYKNISTAGLASDIPSWLLAWRNGQTDYSPFDRLISLEAKTISTGSALRSQITEQLRRFLLIGVLGNFAIVLGLAIFFWQSIAKRLTNLMKNTVLLRRQEELLPPLGGSDEIAELDSALHGAASKILEVEKSKKQLISAISHDIKAPLSAVNSLLVMISSKVYGELPQKAASIVDKAEKDSQNLVRLVMNLLDLERLGSKLKLSQNPVGAIIERGLDFAEEAADRRGITIMTEVSPELTARCDPDQLVLCLSNLLSNIIEAAEKDSLITINAGHSDGYLQLNITYTGKKTDAKTESTASTDLTISETIAKMHGGGLSFRAVNAPENIYSLQIPDGFVSAEQSTASEPPFEKRKGWSIWQKGLLLICLPFLFQLIFMSTLSFLLLQAGQEINQQERSREIVDTVHRINEKSCNAFLFMAVDIGFHEKRIKDAYSAELRNIDSSLNKLFSLSESDENRREFAKKIADATRNLIAEYTTAQNNMKNKSGTLSGLVGDSNQEASDELFKDRQILTNELDNLTAYEGRRRIQYEREAAAIEHSLNQVIIGGITINLLIALSLTVLLNKGITERIAIVMDNARLLSQRKPLLPAMQATDEIGELDAAFHEAADNLYKQQEKKDKLIAIVSNELGKPLRNIQHNLRELQNEKSGTLNKKTGEKIALAEQGVSRLVKLISDLLEIESTKFNIPVAKKTDS